MEKTILQAIMLTITCLTTSANYFSQSRYLFPIQKPDSMASHCCRTGFIDESGEVAIQFCFYYASEFSEGLSAVILFRGGKWGYADTSGKVVIEPQFDNAASFSDGLARVSKNGADYYITKDGKTAFTTSLRLLGFRDGLSPAEFNGKWGFVDRNGELVVPFGFQTANPFYEGLSAVTQKGLIGYIDKSGNWVIRPRFSRMLGLTDPLFLPNFSEGLAVYRDNQKYGFIDDTGKVRIPAAFERAESFSDGFALIRSAGKVGYLDKNGQLAIAPIFDGGSKFSEGMASVLIGHAWGYIDETGKLSIGPQYNSAEPFKNGLARVSTYNERDRSVISGYINRQGAMIYSWQ